MKKQTVFQWVFLMSLVGLATVLSCTSEFPIDGYGRQARKEKQDRHKNTELTKSAARQWYEANYEPVVATRANYEDTTVCMMKPKWENAKESNRRRYEVYKRQKQIHPEHRQNSGGKR